MEKALPVYDVVEESGTYALHRNGRFLMTPGGTPYRLANKGLIEAIAEEWRAQGDKIVPATMPMTQLCATSFDIVGKDREKIVRGLLAYTASELLCHRAERPESLQEKQQKEWQPLLDWAAEKYGAHFCVGCGVMPITQKNDVAGALHKAIDGLDDFWLAGLSSAVDSSGSLVLGLALMEKMRTAGQVFQASELDATHQAVVWGEDPVLIARQAAVRRDLESCERWFAYLRG